MERFIAPMATWEIVGGDLPPVRVRARTFDEALAKARLRDLIEQFNLTSDEAERIYNELLDLEQKAKSEETEA